MTLPHFLKEELIEYFAAHGYDELIRTKGPSGSSVLIFSNQSEQFYVIEKQVYFFHKVCTLCEQINIPIPEEFRNARDQWNNYPS